MRLRGCGGEAGGPSPPAGRPESAPSSSGRPFGAAAPVHPRIFAPGRRAHEDAPGIGRGLLPGRLPRPEQRAGPRHAFSLERARRLRPRTPAFPGGATGAGFPGGAGAGESGETHRREGGGRIRDDRSLQCSASSARVATSPCRSRGGTFPGPTSWHVSGKRPNEARYEGHRLARRARHGVRRAQGASRPAARPGRSGRASTAGRRSGDACPGQAMPDPAPRAAASAGAPAPTGAGLPVRPSFPIVRTGARTLPAMGAGRRRTERRLHRPGRPPSAARAATLRRIPE